MPGEPLFIAYAPDGTKGDDNDDDYNNKRQLSVRSSIAIGPSNSYRLLQPITSGESLNLI